MQVTSFNIDIKWNKVFSNIRSTFVWIFFLQHIHIQILITLYGMKVGISKTRQSPSLEGYVV